MIGDDVLDGPAIELVAKLDAGAFTAVELAQAYLARIERVQPKLNCFVTVTAKRALEDAARADAERAAGKRGGILGVPYVLKDAIDTAGIATTWGTKSLQNRVPAKDAVVSERLRAAGGVLLGKASLTELCNAFSNKDPRNNHGGPCRNPWDVVRWAGGSSGGSASATAAALCGFAIGTETWGSIDHPAGWCGVVGLRPTYDLVPRTGAMALSWTLDKLGVICRDARDAKLVLPILSGSAPSEAVDPKTLRVAVADAMAEPDGDPANFPTWAKAKAVLVAEGLTLQPIELPELPSREAISTIIQVDALVALDELVRTNAPLYDAEPISAKAAAFEKTGISALDYVQAMRIRALVQDAYAKLFEQFDVIAAFGNSNLPLEFGKEPLDIKKHGARMKQSAQGNLAGLPAITLPIGFTAGGLPRSMQLVAAPFEEHKLFAIAELFQANTDHHKKRPKL